MKIQLVVFCLFLNARQMTSNAIGVQKNYKIDNFTICSKNDDLAKMIYYNFTQLSTTSVIGSWQVELLENITGSIKTQFLSHRCSIGLSKECHLLHNFTLPDACILMKRENAIWSPAVRLIKPKLECPIKAGIYTMHNGAADLNLLQIIPLEGYLWKVKIIATEHKLLDGQSKQNVIKEIGCGKVELLITIGARKQISRPSRIRKTVIN